MPNPTIVSPSRETTMWPKKPELFCVRSEKYKGEQESKTNKEIGIVSIPPNFSH